MLGSVTRARLLLASALVASLVAPTTAAGRTVHLTCHDGDPQVVQKGVGAIPSDEATCDSVSDGVCAFTVRVPVGPCLCPTIACCQTTVSSEVPVKRKKRLLLPGRTRMVLRCLRRPAIPIVRLSSNVQPILDQSCAVAGCHLGPVSVQGMDLSAGKTFSSTVEVKSTEIPRLLRITPGKPNDSYLVQKIEGIPGITGLQEPPGCPGTALNGAQCLSVEDITVIRQWITEGALNN
jgi:hypothetical protein